VVSDRRPEDDPLGLRADAPLLDGYLEYLRGPVRPFTTPGHKGSTDLVGVVVANDIPLYGGVDTIRARDGRLAAAERKVADLWGADWARIATGGSTHGNQTLALAVGSPGDEIIVTRTLHRSLLLGIMLAGLVPVWVQPDIDAATGLPAGIPPERVARVLADHPQAKAVFLVEPGYIGTMSDVAAHADVAHAHDIPLLVDQAWGAYLGFHPDLPRHALQAGADALVTSTHKTLPAYTQSALVMARTDRLDRSRLDRAFETTNTTSPSGSIAASADAVRALLSRDGERLLGHLLRIVTAARQDLRKIPGVWVMEPGSMGPTIVDPVKLVIGVAGAGVNGMELEDGLIARGFPVEMADHDTVVPMVTIADNLDDVTAFTSVFAELVERHRSAPRVVRPSSSWTVRSEPVMTPRDAYFARHETVSADESIGRISAELVAPYPPGVPVLAPGERITQEAVSALRQALAEGTLVKYAADPSLETFQVVSDR
jgi:arginine decarboxylase